MALKFIRQDKLRFCYVSMRELEFEK